MDFYTVEKGTSTALLDTKKIAEGLRRAASSAGPLTHDGIRLLRAGQREGARLILEAALQENRADLLAWLWYAAAVSNVREQRNSLVHALRLDPSNPAAWCGLAYLDRKPDTRAKATGSDLAADPLPLAPDRISLTQPMHARPAVLDEQSPLGSWPGRSRVLLRAGPSVLPATAVSSVFVMALGAVSGLISLSGPLGEVWPVLLIVLLISLAIILLQFTWRMSMQYTLTDKWLVIQSGILRRRSTSIPLTALKGVEYRGWRLFNRLTGAGDVVLSFRDSDSDLRLRNIADCKQVVEQVTNALHKLAYQRRA